MRPLHRVLGLTLLIALPASHASATAPDSEAFEAQRHGDHAGGAWRGSTLTWRNSASAISFDRSAELTYNPTWVTSFELAPRYAASDVVSLSARLDLAYELTEADDTTYANEAVLGNLVLGVAARRWATIPGVDVVLSGGLSLVLPTSKAARAQTLLFSVLPRIRLARSFPVLAGLNLSYDFTFGKSFHRMTTAERESPLVSGCFNAAGGCESQLNTGLRNASWLVVNSFGLNLGITEWLSFDAALSIYTSFLYDDVRDERVSLTPQTPTSTRHALYYDLSLTVTPTSPLDVVLGVQTFNPQRRPDSTNYAPFFNRYTALYLDLRLDLAQLVALAAE